MCKTIYDNRFVFCDIVLLPVLHNSDNNNTGCFSFEINAEIGMDRFVIRSKRKKSDAEEVKHAKQQRCDIVEETVKTSLVKFRPIRGENLNLDYAVLFNKQEADGLLKECEEQLEYNTGDLAKVHVFGKWHDIPRKQVAHGDSGLAYTFSGKTLPARPWTSLLVNIRDRITGLTGHTFNFVLINRYKDGSDHMGEHRDDEKDLVRESPIASVTLGQARDFVFKHGDSRGKNARRSVTPVKIVLEHGSLLMMNYPTNVYWYHSLPPRKKLTGVRINMTFRQMVKS